MRMCYIRRGREEVNITSVPGSVQQQYNMSIKKILTDYAKTLFIARKLLNISMQQIQYFDKS